jgi:hypothetical protein
VAPPVNPDPGFSMTDKSQPMLPTTLAASESDGGLSTKITFERVIVFPDGHREIEGVTPKQLPVPATPDASGT